MFENKVKIYNIGNLKTCYVKVGGIQILNPLSLEICIGIRPNAKRLNDETQSFGDEWLGLATLLIDLGVACYCIGADRPYQYRGWL